MQIKFTLLVLFLVITCNFSRIVLKQGRRESVPRNSTSSFRRYVFNDPTSYIDATGYVTKGMSDERAVKHSITASWYSAAACMNIANNAAAAKRPVQFDGRALLAYVYAILRVRVPLRRVQHGIITHTHIRRVRT